MIIRSDLPSQPTKGKNKGNKQSSASETHTGNAGNVTKDPNAFVCDDEADTEGHPTPQPNPNPKHTSS